MKGFLKYTGFGGLKKGFQIFDKGFGFPYKGFGIIANLFARYFNQAIAWIQLAGIYYLSDILHPSRPATTTVVWAADGTAVLEITESDYPEITDWSTVVISYLTTNKVGKLITGVSAAGIYTVTFPVGNVSNVKIIHDSTIPSIYSDLNVELATYGLKTATWQEPNVITVGKWIRVTMTTETVTTAVFNSASFDNDSSQRLIKQGTHIYYLLPKSTTFGLTVVAGAFSSSSTIVEEVGWDQSTLVTGLNIKGDQVGVVGQFSMEEDAGDGATDNLIAFDRLNDGLYSTIAGGVSGSIWDTDSTIESINNALGYGVALGTEIGGLVEIGSSIPISATNPTLTVVGAVPTFTGQAGYPAQLVDQNCVKTTNIQTIQLSANVINGNKWAFEIDLDEVNTAQSYNMLLGNDIATDNYISLKVAGTHTFRIRPASGFVDGTYDTSNITNGILRCVSNTTNVKIYHNDALVDTITVDADLLINRIFNFDTEASALGYNGKANNAKIWNLTAYSQAQIDALDFDALAPTNWFALNEYDNELTLPSTLTFYDVMETGVTGVLTNGSNANISKTDGMSGNFRYGNNYKTVLGGTAIVQASQVNPELDAEGVTLVNKPSDKSSYTKSEQKGIWPNVPELKELGVSFLNTDLVTQMPINTANVMNKIKFSEMAGINANNVITITDEIITDVQFKNQL